MKVKKLLLGTFFLYLLFFFVYILFIFIGLDDVLVYSILIISSISILPPFTIYTIIESKKEPDKLILKKKVPSKKKTFKGISNDFINDYFEAMPLVDDYADSDNSYEEVPKMHDFIFSLFGIEETAESEE